MELRHRALARLRFALTAMLVAALIVPAAAAAADGNAPVRAEPGPSRTAGNAPVRAEPGPSRTAVRPASDTEPPRFFDRTAREVERIAARAEKVRSARAGGALDPVAYTKGPGRWQVSFSRDTPAGTGGDEVVQVLVDDESGAIVEQWDGPQVAWTMARGYEGAFARTLNAPYVWIPLCLLFLAPFIDLRRPFRLLHLDLLAMLAFGVSHVFFNRGEVDLSAPLVYPVLIYLLVRVLWAGFRPRERQGPLVPHVPLTLLAIGLVFLVAFRIGLNVVDSNVIDVGYAGVIGADRLVDGDQLYGEGFSGDVERGDTYGPVNYLLYVPFEQALPWSGGWDELPAAHGAAILFDLLVIGGLLLLGRRLRPGREGTFLGVALAYAWTAYPYTSFVLESNANDSLVALAGVAALLASTLAGRRASGAWSAVALALGSAAKFASVALAPLFARRAPLLFVAVFALVVCAVVLPFVPDGGLREIYDRTIGYQAGRPSPFSLWGRFESLDWLQTLVKAGAACLALAVAFVPRRVDARGMAALGAAVLIALQLTAGYWFYLYVVWFTPFLLVTAFGAYRSPSAPAEEEPQPERALVAA